MVPGAVQAAGPGAQGLVWRRSAYATEKLAWNSEKEGSAVITNGFCPKLVEPVAQPVNAYCVVPSASVCAAGATSSVCLLPAGQEKLAVALKYWPSTENVSPAG